MKKQTIDQEYSDASEVIELLEEIKGDQTVCIRCGHPKIHKHGKTERGIPRFICVECRGTFSLTTDTPFSHLQHIEKWIPYCDCLLKSLTIRQSAKTLNMSVDTSFRWRHRFTFETHQDEATKLCGQVEFATLFMNKSHKGDKGHPAPIWKNGMKEAQFPDDYVAINFAVDEKNEADEISGTGLPKSEWLTNHLLGRVEDAEISVNWPGMGFINACESAKINYKAFKVSLKENSPEPLKRVQSYIGHFISWMKQFHGVATKYLYHYLGWFYELYQRKIETPISLLTKLFAINSNMSVALQSKCKE